MWKINNHISSRSINGEIFLKLEKYLGEVTKDLWTEIYEKRRYYEVSICLIDNRSTVKISKRISSEKGLIKIDKFVRNVIKKFKLCPK